MRVPESRSERKLAAILSADVVGYSRLMSEDEADTIHRLGDYRESVSMLVQQHRGRVVDSPGDNIMADFPTALDAVRAAMEIQGVLRARNAELPRERRMEFRIGVHMGDVAVEGERIYGDGVNIAARLEGLAEAGGICISATVHEQVRNKLGIGFTDLGDQTVKNIPDQVRVYRLQPRAPDSDRVAAPTRSSHRLRLWLATPAVLLLVAGGLWASWPAPLGLVLDLTGVSETPVAPPLPDKPSVVVLPFSNMTGDAAQEFLADGMTEELTADLAGNPSIFVIARNSAFSYKGRPVRVEDVGRELGVRYVVEGSVRRSGDRVRITAQLIDATSGVHLWSRQYDRQLDDLFAVQSEISQGILAAVGVEVREAEMARIRRRPTGDLTAYEAYTKGIFAFIQLTRDSHEQAQRLFERAIELDPDYGSAYAMLAVKHVLQYVNGWSFDRTLLDRSRELLKRARELDPSYVGVQQALALLAYVEGRTQQTLDHARKAIKLAPSFAPAHGMLAVGLARDGQPLAALESLSRAMRLDPHWSESAAVGSVRAGLLYQAGRIEQAVALMERAREASPDLITVRLDLADHYARAGQLDQARALMEEVLSASPELTVEMAMDLALRTSARTAEHVASLGENLRKAGLP